MPLAWLSAGFQSLLPPPTSKLGPSGADSWLGRLVYILRPWGSLHRTLLWGWELLPLLPQPPQVFSVRGFEALFPCSGTLGCVVCLAPQLFLPAYPQVNVGLPSPQDGSPSPLAAALPWVLSTGLPISAPPTGLDQCFFFNSLVVRLPYSLIYCQFWLYFVFKFVIVLLLVVWGGKVYLPTSSSWPEVRCLRKEKFIYFLTLLSPAAFY